VEVARDKATCTTGREARVRVYLFEVQPFKKPMQAFAIGKPARFLRKLL
jgi:hypothetical protein